MMVEETRTVLDPQSRAGAHGERLVYTCPECGVAYDAAPGADAPTCDCEDDVAALADEHEEACYEDEGEAAYGRAD